MRCPGKCFAPKRALFVPMKRAGRRMSVGVWVKCAERDVRNGQGIVTDGHHHTTIIRNVPYYIYGISPYPRANPRQMAGTALSHYHRCARGKYTSSSRAANKTRSSCCEQVASTGGGEHRSRVYRRVIHTMWRYNSQTPFIQLRGSRSHDAVKLYKS